MPFCSHLATRIIGLALLSLLTVAPAALAAEEKPGAHAVSLYNLGLTAYKQGSPESAIIFFRRATDLDPDLADAHYNLAVIYQAQKRYKEAIPRFEQVLRVKPTDADAHFQLAIILQETGRLPEAKDHFSNIAPNNPHFAECQQRMAQINSQLSGGAQLKGQSGFESTPNYGQNQSTVAANMSGSRIDESPMQTVAPSSFGYAAQNYNNQQMSAQTQQQMPVEQPVQQLQPIQPVQQAAPTPSPVPTIANSTLRVIATGFSAPSGIAFDRQGNLYIANFLSNTIDRITLDGSRMQFSAGINLKGPIGITIDETGNVYVANYNSGTIARINPAGVATIIASGFKKPYYLALDNDGNLYVSQQEDNSVVRITLPKSAARSASK
ncbi:MAG: tetratricopeptide repeat protein [Candidatus Obscuribacterales bacterium]|nr:tetratricopeptide repeat protein [Candidatus Obscuribacterales bacterium]